MTGKERLMSAFHGVKADRLPWSPLINNYSTSGLHTGDIKKNPFEFSRFIGADIAERWVAAYQGYGIDYPNPTNPKIEFSSTMVNGVCINQYTTPYGTLIQHKKSIPSAGDTFFITKHYVETIEDLPAYKYIWESMEIVDNYDNVADMLSILQDDGVALVSVPTSPLLQLIMYHMGLEVTNIFMMDYPEEFNSLFETMSEKCIQACRIAAKCQNEILIIPENSGTRLVTPTQFERYCQPIISEFADISHKNRKMLFMHACGHLKYLLPYIAKTKIDGIESLTSPPTGDTTITDVWDIFDGKCVIWGGLDPVSFANNSPAKLVDEVTKTWETVKNNPRFILMPSDSTPANVPMENFEIIRKTVEAFRY